MTEALDNLRQGLASIWQREAVSGMDDIPGIIPAEELDAAAMRLERFTPLLEVLFGDDGWDGRIRSDLLPYPPMAGTARCYVKGDHALPMTGSIKARGGVHDLLFYVEHVARQHGLLTKDVTDLALAPAREAFANHHVLVASTGNLGYSVGLVARAIGLNAEVHMSHDAKQWKKDRLRDLGATVVEHPVDYSETVAHARKATQERPNCWFVDDESSRHLLTGYAAAGAEVAEQLAELGIRIGPDRRLIVYLPCGVGGAPGGITLGLKRIFGANVICVFVEPTASACMLTALASQIAPAPTVYDFGCDNRTIADGLAVPRASDLVLSAVAPAIDTVVAVPDAMIIEWVDKAWRDAGLRLEPSAAAAFAAVPVLRAAPSNAWGFALDEAIHLCWATGGSRLPDHEFLPLLEAASAIE